LVIANFAQNGPVVASQTWRHQFGCRNWQLCSKKNTVLAQDSIIINGVDRFYFYYFPFFAASNAMVAVAKQRPDRW
jgi:hypothetical protein